MIDRETIDRIYAAANIVDIIGEDEINACKKVCEEYSLNLRIRRYEAN